MPSLNVINSFSLSFHTTHKILTRVRYASISSLYTGICYYTRPWSSEITLTEMTEMNFHVL